MESRYYVSIWPLLCSQRGECPLMYSMAYARYHSATLPVEALQGLCQARVPDKGTVRTRRSVCMWESQCWDLTLSVTVTGAAWLPLLFTASDQSRGGPLGRLLSWASAPVPLHPDKKQWGKACFPPCLFGFTVVNQTSGLGGRKGGVGGQAYHGIEKSVPRVRDWCPCPELMLCHHCSDRLGRFQIILGLFSMMSNDALALRQKINISYW